MIGGGRRGGGGLRFLAALLALASPVVETKLDVLRNIVRLGRRRPKLLHVPGRALDHPRLQRREPGRRRQRLRHWFWPVGRLLDTFRKEASGVSGLQHSHNIASPAIFWPTECLMAPASYSSACGSIAVMSAPRGLGPP